MSHLRFHRAVHRRGTGGLHTPTAEGFGAWWKGGVGDTVSHFMLQGRRALTVQFGALLNIYTVGIQAE